CRVCVALPTESSRRERSLARAERPDDVKKLIGLSSAELTFLPVDRRSCVRLRSSAVPCNESRFWRTPFERVISEAIGNCPFLGLTRTHRPPRSGESHARLSHAGANAALLKRTRVCGAANRDTEIKKW